MPIWLMGIICVVLLCLSGLFSGLNLGLMSLDHTELQILINTGSDNDKRWVGVTKLFQLHYCDNKTSLTTWMTHKLAAYLLTLIDWILDD